MIFRKKHTFKQGPKSKIYRNIMWFMCCGNVDPASAGSCKSFHSQDEYNPHHPLTFRQKQAQSVLSERKSAHCCMFASYNWAHLSSPNLSSQASFPHVLYVFPKVVMQPSAVKCILLDIKFLLSYKVNLDYYNIYKLTSLRKLPRHIPNSP